MIHNPLSFPATDFSGMLLMGICFGNLLGFKNFSVIYESLSFFICNIALIIIITRISLVLKIENVRKVGNAL